MWGASGEGSGGALCGDLGLPRSVCQSWNLCWAARPTPGRAAGTHRVHVDAIGIGPGVLEVLFEALPQRVGDLVEADELPHPEHLRVVAGRARVQPLDDGRHVAEDAGVHEGWGHG